MKTFHVYKHPVRGYQAVKIGFSWPAFFFTWIWVFIKKLWGYGLAIIAVAFVLSIVHSAFAQEESLGGMLFISLIGFGINILCGIKGNNWRNSSLKKLGYEHIQALEAETSAAAIASVAKSNTDEIVKQLTRCSE